MESISEKTEKNADEKLIKYERARINIPRSTYPKVRDV